MNNPNYEFPDTVTITWSVEDVQGLAGGDKLTAQQCREVLQAFVNNHEGSMQAMWEDLQYHLDNYLEELEENGN